MNNIVWVECSKADSQITDCIKERATANARWLHAIMRKLLTIAFLLLLPVALNARLIQNALAQIEKVAKVFLEDEDRARADGLYDSNLFEGDLNIPPDEIKEAYMDQLMLLKVRFHNTYRGMQYWNMHDSDIDLSTLLI